MLGGLRENSFGTILFSSLFIRIYIEYHLYSYPQGLRLILFASKYLAFIDLSHCNEGLKSAGAPLGGTRCSGPTTRRLEEPASYFLSLKDSF